MQKNFFKMNDNFKNWMGDFELPKLNRKKNYLIGLEVYPKIRTKKLSSLINFRYVILTKEVPLKLNLTKR